MPDDAEAWEKVVKKLRAGTMPPQGAPRPDEATQAALVTWLETTIDRASAARPNPGRPALHRLNRAEYQNAIRDLLALDVDAAALLPPDDSSYGFDNVADVLGVSPALLERYMGAAEKISALAVGDPSLPPTDETYRVRFDLTQTRHIDGLPLGTRGGTLVRETFPLDGEYIIKPKLWRTNVGFIRGLAYPHQIEITVDGARVHLVTVGTPEDFATSLMGPQNAVKIIEERMQVRVPIKAGPRTIGVAFVEKSEAMSPTLLRPYLSTLDPVDSEGVPQLETVTVSGPFSVTGPGDTPSRRRIFSCRPSATRGTASSESKGAPSSRAGNDTACAKQILSALARLAYRRPVSDADLGPLLAFYETGRQQGNFDAGIQLAVERMLVGSPIRVPGRTRPGRPGARHGVSRQRSRAGLTPLVLPVEQHSGRAAAGAGQPRASSAIRRCSSSRSGGCCATRGPQALVSNFAGQWLYLRNLKNVVPSKDQFPEFDDNLRQAFQRETELLVESVMREDRSVLDLLTADYTFVNERLAQALRHPERLRQPVPPRAGRERGAPRPARARQHPDGHLAGEPHVAGAAREVDARQPARHAAATAAARRAAAQGQRRTRAAVDDARADGGAPRERRRARRATS